MPQRACDFEKVRRIVAGIHAKVDHHVVARLFAFPIEPVARDPEKRVEPVNNTRELSEHLEQSIQTTHVREFVRDDDTFSFLGPFVDTLRDEYLRM